MIQTNKIVPATPENLQLAAMHLLQGRAVVFPTDTVYGVGVIATNSAAIAHLYKVKERPLDKGLPVLISDASRLQEIADSAENPHIQQLIKTYWPGPLTLILPRQATLPQNISPNSGIAVRIPDNTITQQLIRAAGGAVATSSANLSGQPDATTAQAANAMLGDRVALILDGGPSPHAVASTIVDFMVSPPQIRRHGPISQEDIMQEIAK